MGSRAAEKRFLFILTLGPKSAYLQRASAVFRKTLRLSGDISFLALEESSSKMTSKTPSEVDFLWTNACAPHGYVKQSV